MRRNPLLAALLLAALPALAAPEPASDPYAPLAFLAGHCWKGTMPDGKKTDEHCFEWIYDRKFLRDRHVVKGGKSDYVGETIYFFNPVEKKVEYLYIENAGGFSRGAMTADGAALAFPPTEFVEQGKTRRYRSRWQPDGDAAYDVLTESERDAGWELGWKVHMVRQ
jgi:hypothetical protein